MHDAKQPGKKRKGGDEVRAPMPDEQRSALLDRLALGLAGKLKMDVAARQNSGIEKIWLEDEDHYEGVDDANRHEFGHIASKPTESGRDTQPRRRSGSTLFPNITQPYVDAAAAKISDMLLPTDDRNFVVEPTPVPDILDEEEGFAPAADPSEGLVAVAPEGVPATDPAGQQFAQQMLAGGAAAAPQQPQPAAPLDALGAMLKKLETIRQKAAEAAERAQDQIDDFLVECSYHTELRQVIHDAARIGTGIIKGPVPRKVKVQAWARDPQTGERVLVIKEETKPVSVRVDPWNLFPAKDCGENIHRGSRLWERDFLTDKQLAGLKKGTGAAAYFDSVIDKVLEEGPKKNGLVATRGLRQSEDAIDSEFEVWYYYGEITAEELEAVGCICEDRKARYPVIITMVNDRVIKAALNPLDNGEFPFDLLAWKQRRGMPWGAGIGRQGRVAQRIVVAGTRNLMDNAGASSRPHKVTTDAIEPGGDPWTWRMNPDGGSDVSKAMMFFVQPSLQAELMAIITMGERMMELHTGLPMVILGIQGDVEETAHGRALQNNNGSMVMRRLAKNFDGGITEPHIRRYHIFGMLYVDDYPKDSDFQIKARGSAALVERDLQNQQMPMLMQMSLQPAYEMDPKRARDEWLKGLRFDPKAFDLTEERKKELAAKAQPPVIPVIEATKIREAEATKRHQLDLQDKQAERQHESQEAALDRQLEEMTANVEAQLRGAELTMEQRLALDDFKVTLAGIAMKLRTQRELSAMKGGEATKPPSEPQGRAAPGRSFEQ